MSKPVTGSDDLRDLYRELILDHARSPRHFGRIADATHSASGINPLCGDKLHLYVRIGPDKTIADIGFEGTGCAISIASASLLTEALLGTGQDEALGYAEKVVQTLSGKHHQSEATLGKLQALAGVRDYPSRVKCATLAWRALNSAVLNEQGPVSTES